MGGDSRIVQTTHTGSLPRPERLLALLFAYDRAEEIEAAAFDEEIRNAVADVVRRQVELGLDYVSDGELSKISYTLYVKHRLSGLSNVVAPEISNLRNKPPRDLVDFPEVLAVREQRAKGLAAMRPTYCVGDVRYIDRAPLERDLANFRSALAGKKPSGAFLTAASPGVLVNFIVDAHYGNEDNYLADLADAMREEYQAITDAGFQLQIDCPDLAMARHFKYQDVSESEFLKIVERNIEAINHATAGIAPEMMKMHICWGNYAGPHTRDIPVTSIVNVVMKCRPQAISFEAANPRHEHEWEDWKASAVPDDKVLIPGVIDSTTNFVEHPRLVAQRIGRFEKIVGRERLIAGSDCGFGSFAGRDYVHPSVAWAKLGTLVEGARLASGNVESTPARLPAEPTVKTKSNN